MCSRMRSMIIPSVLLAMAWALAGRAMADSISDIQEAGTVGSVTLDGNPPGGPQGAYPVITQLLSQPGTYNGKTYGSWAFLANDGSGSENANSDSLDVFGISSTSTYTPTVGDALIIAGKYSPYNQIPEVGSVTSIGYPTPAQLAVTGQSATGNPSPSPTPVLTTIPTINVSNLAAQAPTLAGQYLEVDDVTLGGFTDRTQFGTNNSPSGGTTITDGSSNSMTLYYWPTSYGEANINLANKLVPTGPVDVFGIVDVFGTGATAVAEFVPINMTNTDGSPLTNAPAVPEPGTLALLGASLAVAAAAFVRRRKLSK